MHSLYSCLQHYFKLPINYLYHTLCTGLSSERAVTVVHFVMYQTCRLAAITVLNCFRIVVSFDLNENTNQDESTLDEDIEEDDDHDIMGKVTV